MKKLLFLFMTILCLSGSSNAQAPIPVDPTNAKAVRLAKKNLTYYWVGNSAPLFINTEYKCGFKIRRAGCLSTRPIRRHNRRVIRKINWVYGHHWFQDNTSNFY